MLTFAALFAALLATGAFVSQRPELAAGLRYFRVPAPEGDFYPVSELDYYVLTRGLKGTEQRMRGADVLILGNSRVHFGLRAEDAVPAFAKRCLDVYNLAFGAQDSAKFPLAILERFELRPKLIVVNADGFFGSKLTPLGKRALSMDDFVAFRSALEVEWAWYAKKLVHAYVPHWPTVMTPNPWVLYRSVENGFWFIASVPAQRHPVTKTTTVGAVREEAFQEAIELKRTLDAEGIELVFTLIPYSSAPTFEARAIAERIGVPLFAPELGGLMTVDQSHLDEASARRVTEAIFAELGPWLDRQGLGCRAGSRSHHE